MYHPTTIVVREKKRKYCNYKYHPTTIVVSEKKENM